MIKSLTSLRGIFILFIFFHHCLNLYPGGGSMAVAFFFVLGGFSMTLGYQERILSEGFNYKQYLSRRLKKFYPLHWLCLLAAIPFFLVSFNWLKLPILVSNTVLLQTWVPDQRWYFSLNAVSWYLADTMFFAIVFPFLLKWIVKASDFGKTMIALSFVVFYMLVAVFIPYDMHHAILYISPYMRLTDFVFGIYLALLYFKLKEKPIALWNRNIVSQIIVVALIAILVVESCQLSEDARLFAPVYWIPVAMVVIIASLSNTNGGGVQPIGKQMLISSWRAEFYHFFSSSTGNTLLFYRF